MLSLIGVNYWVYNSSEAKTPTRSTQTLAIPKATVESTKEIEHPSLKPASPEARPVAVANANNEIPAKVALSPLEEIFIAHKLIDIQSIDPSIQVDLKYASEDNFMEANVYGNMHKCYLQKEVAVKLSKAQEYLKEKKPQYSIVIFDGARPKSVQQKMWDLVKGTSAHKYVASPNHGSIHNYGAAVDVSIVDADGKELDMGTDYDFFGDLAQPRYERQFSQTGELMPNQLANRILLREVMKKAGFKGILSEWWHFESDRLEKVKKKFHLIQ